MCKIWTVPDLRRKGKGAQRQGERYTDTHSIHSTYSIHILYAATESYMKFQPFNIITGWGGLKKEYLEYGV